MLLKVHPASVPSEVTLDLVLKQEARHLAVDQTVSDNLAVHRLQDQLNQALLAQDIPHLTNTTHLPSLLTRKVPKTVDLLLDLDLSDLRVLPVLQEVLQDLRISLDNRLLTKMVDICTEK